MFAVSSWYNDTKYDKFQCVRMCVSQWYDFVWGRMCSVLGRHICRTRRYQNHAVRALWLRPV